MLRNFTAETHSVYFQNGGLKNIIFVEKSNLLDYMLSLSMKSTCNGLIYEYSIRLFDGGDAKIFANVNGLDKNNTLKFGAFTDTERFITPFCAQSIVIE